MDPGVRRDDDKISMMCMFIARAEATENQSMTSTPRTLFDKLWDAHVVVPEPAAAPAVL